MIDLYLHQSVGINWLIDKHSAMLCDEMGLGKSRQALVAARHLYREKRIDRVLILAPAAVRFSWRAEIDKLGAADWLPGIYNPKTQKIYGENRHEGQPLPVLILSYSLLPQARHVAALEKWCLAGNTVLICDESSFLKNRTGKQTKGAAKIAENCIYKWLLTGTPIANSPLDLYGQALVMSNGIGPLKTFKNWWSFRSRYAVLKQMNMGRIKFQQVVAYQNLDELTKRFAPYVLRREKKDCLDLPEKIYEVREIALEPKTWAIYQELKKEAMLCLPDSEEKPEPNAAVRILRLCQLTSGHVGLQGGSVWDYGTSVETERLEQMIAETRDVSDEKLSWLVEQIIDGELSNERALIVWCRWRRERERLVDILRANKTRFDVLEVYGGQSQREREESISFFQETLQGTCRRILLAQPHAGGFGLTLTAASTAVYLSNDFSYTTRIQSEDRIHRIGQHHPCLYLDVLATGPNGQKTIDHHVLECLRNKKSVADIVCSEWRKALA